MNILAVNRPNTAEMGQVIQSYGTPDLHDSEDEMLYNKKITTI